MLPKEPLVDRLRVIEQRLKEERKDFPSFNEDDSFLCKISGRDLKHIIAAVEFMDQKAKQAEVRFEN